MTGNLVLCGGGLDSFVAAWDIQLTYPDPTTLLFFDYGQRACDQEWHATKQIAIALTNRFHTAMPIMVEIAFFRQFARSALLELGPAVETNPKKGVAHEWTPARNTVFTALGISFAEANNFDRLVVGINATAAEAYPDNDRRWAERWRALIPFAVNKGTQIELETPLDTLTKTEIVKLGSELQIPWNSVDTWSCYEGGTKHCGKCSSCRARYTAFADAGVEDRTEYAQ